MNALPSAALVLLAIVASARKLTSTVAAMILQQAPGAGTGGGPAFD